MGMSEPSTFMNLRVGDGDVIITEAFSMETTLDIIVVENHIEPFDVQSDELGDTLVDLVDWNVVHLSWWSGWLEFGCWLSNFALGFEFFSEGATA